MAISLTDRGPASASASSGTISATCASFTPGVGRLLVVLAGGIGRQSGNVITLTISDTFGAAVGAWTSADTQHGVGYSAACARSQIWYAWVESTPAAGTITVARDAAGEGAIGFTVLEIDGADPLNPIRQSAKNNAQGPTSVTATFASSPDADSLYAAVGVAIWSDMTLPSGFTLLDDLDSSAQSDDGEVVTVYDATPAGTTVQWTGGNGDVMNTVAVEIQDVQSLSATATPAVAAMTLAAPAATGINHKTGNPGAFALALTPRPPTVTGTGNAAPAAVALAVTPRAVSPVGGSGAYPGTAALVVTPRAVTLAYSGRASPAAAALVLGIIGPQVFVDGVPVFAAFARDVSSAGLLDLEGVSVRTDSIVFELLDNAHNLLGQIHPEFAQASIQNATDSGIKRRMTGLIISPDEYADVDVIAHRIRPVWVLENGSRYPQGIFLFAAPQYRRYSFGLIGEAALVDQGLILDQPLSSSLGWAAGYPVRDAMIETAEAAGITNYRFDLSAATIGSDVAYPASQSHTYAKVLDHLAGIAGFHPAYFDNAGQLVGRAVPDLAVAVPSLVYGADESSSARMISGSMVESNDLLTAPNRYLVVDNTATGGAVVAVYDVPATAPHSIARRGFAIPKVLEAPGVGNVDQAMEFARAHDASTPSAYETVTFSSPADPRHDTFDLITYRGVTFVELGWRLSLAPGGPMDHTAQRIYVP